MAWFTQRSSKQKSPEFSPVLQLPFEHGRRNRREAAAAGTTDRVKRPTYRAGIPLEQADSFLIVEGSEEGIHAALADDAWIGGTSVSLTGMVAR
jgi:hypothetical protein